MSSQLSTERPKMVGKSEFLKYIDEQKHLFSTYKI